MCNFCVSHRGCKALITVGCRTGVAAGSPVPIELMKQLSQKLHLTELTVAYGMSTCGPFIVLLFQTDLTLFALAEFR